MKTQTLNFKGLSLTGLALFTASVFIPSKNAVADDVTDLYFQQVVERYFEYPQTARNFALGGSTVQTATDSSAVIGNPAGLGRMQGGELSGTYSFNQISGNEFPTGRNVKQEGNIGSGILALPIGPTENDLPQYGNFGLAWNGYDSKWNDDSFNTHTESTQVVASYAYSVSNDLSLGYSIGWIDDKLQSRDVFNYPMGDGFRHTLGALLDIDEANRVGASIIVGHGNHKALYGPGIETESNTFEAGFDTGISHKLNQNTLLAIGAGYRHLNTDGDTSVSIPQNFVGGDENGNIFNVNAGLEYSLSEQLLLRGGYRYAGLSSYKYNRVELNDLNGSAYYNAFSLGAGYVMPLDSDYFQSINLDYGVEYRTAGDGDWQHVITLSLPFVLCNRSDLNA